ncbi:MAG TPA: MBL fold metallo-hydrolase [Gaiellaceae bacterium]|nr:MBL fold metallo-hydrolase [Gaiellaceae bacterium]
MLVRIWGCRGSLATPGRETLRYGGNTSCIEVECDDGTSLILDAGTGIRALGRRLAGERRKEIHLCLTHLHIDHIEGIGFFAPIFDPGATVHIWGPPSSVRSLDERLARYLSAPLFPVELSDLPASFRFHDVEDEPWQIGGAQLVAAHVSHPGATLGYRIEADGSCLTYLPDHEPAVGVELERLTSDWVSGYTLAEGSSLLVHDAQYTDAEYADHVGWGHSSVSQAVSFAAMTHAARLVLFHHDPLHTDDDLDAHASRAQELWRGDGAPPELAFEGMEIHL